MSKRLKVDHQPAETVKKKGILVVDDDPYMRVYLSTVLETSGYAAITAKDGREGIAKAKEIHPLLIILDIMMPGEGGILMYQQLKTDEILEGIPVIMLSGVEGRTFHHSLKTLNVALAKPLPEPEAYLEKPPKTEELLKAMEIVLLRKSTKDA